MKLLAQKREELAAKRKALHEVFQEAGSDMDLAKVKSLSGTTAEKAAEIKRLNTELTALGEEVDGLVELEKTAASVKAMDEKLDRPTTVIAHPSGSPVAPVVKSLGQLFVESPAYKGFSGHRGPIADVSVDVKTLMTTAAGWAPQAIRTGRMIGDEQLLPVLIDFIPSVTTNQNAIVYMEETTYTNNAAERTEGANNAGEAALALTERTSNVREIAVWIPVTKEQLADVSYVQSYVNSRLGLMIRQRLNTQIVVGDGNAPNLIGILDNGWTIQTQAKGSDPTPDAIYKAMTKVRVTGAANPNVVVFHPNDWQDIRLLRTADGIYIWGSPADAGPARIWGLPVVQEASCTENTGIVMDSSYTELAVRENLTFEVTDSHASLFIQRTMAILAYMRAAFTVYRGNAICSVTGI